MEWQVIVALVVILPVILFPAAFVWYLNIGGLYAAVREARKKRAAEEKKALETDRLTAQIMVAEQYRRQRTENWR
jgi:hypothetical protein